MRRLTRPRETLTAGGRGPFSQTFHRAGEKGDTWRPQESRQVLQGHQWPLGALDRGQLPAPGPRPVDNRDPLRAGVRFPSTTSVASRATSGGTARLGQEVSRYFPRRALEGAQEAAVPRREEEDSSHEEGTGQHLPVRRRVWLFRPHLELRGVSTP